MSDGGGDWTTSHDSTSSGGDEGSPSSDPRAGAGDADATDEPGPMDIESVHDRESALEWHRQKRSEMGGGEGVPILVIAVLALTAGGLIGLVLVALVMR